MAIDITGANAYFGASAHTRSESWTKLPQAKRVAAIAQATDFIDNRITEDLETDATVTGDFPRHDAAVYEQALWMIESESVDNLIKKQLFDPTQKGGSLAANIRAMQQLNSIIAPAARRFLFINSGSIELSRG